MERTINKIFIISEHSNTAVKVNDKQKKPDNIIKIIQESYNLSCLQNDNYNQDYEMIADYDQQNL